MKKILCTVLTFLLIFTTASASDGKVFTAGERILCSEIKNNGMLSAAHSDAIGSVAYFSEANVVKDSNEITSPEMSFKFQIEKSGKYVIYVRAILKSEGADSFFYNIDSTGWKDRHPNAQGIDFKWITVGTFEFEKGVHTFDWHHREPDGVFDCFSIIPVDGNYKIIVDGEELKTDVEPYLENGTSMVPFRAFGEVLGAEVNWIAEERAATMTLGSVTLKVIENSDKAYFNKFPITIANPARIINGRFMVPARFVADNLGKNVSWDYTTNHAFISQK